jgi:hypothetical protein
VTVTVDADAGDAGDDGGDAGVVEMTTVDAGPIDAGPCPTDLTVVLADFESLNCPRGWEPGTIVSGPVVPASAGVCCYMVHDRVCGALGRPYLERGVARVAPMASARSSVDWIAGARPSVEGLSTDDRVSLAAAWAQDGLLEHASVASFARASLALLAVGAPASIVALTHDAALDEVRHARLCFALASAYAGEERAPGRFLLGDSVIVPVTLADLAASVAREGCLGETIAAAIAAEQLARATDPAVRAALARISEDEARHAELAWRTVAWAVQVGGPEVREIVAEAFGAPVGAGALRAEDASPAGFSMHETHGRLDRATISSITAEVMASVVAPAAKMLLGRATSPPVVDARSNMLVACA